MLAVGKYAAALLRRRKWLSYFDLLLINRLANAHCKHVESDDWKRFRVQLEGTRLSGKSTPGATKKKEKWLHQGSLWVIWALFVTFVNDLLDIIAAHWRIMSAGVRVK